MDIPEEDIVEASKKANAHEFITDFPDGYDTVVGERGIRYGAVYCAVYSIVYSVQYSVCSV